MASAILAAGVTALDITNPWAAAAAYAAAAYIGSQIDKALFTPSPPPLSSKTATLADPSVQFPIFYGADGWRCPAVLIWARPYTSKKFQNSGRHAYATYAVGLGYSPLGYATVTDIYQNGIHTFDLTRTRNKDGPHSFWNGSQTTADSLIASFGTTSAFLDLIGYTFQRQPVLGWGNQIASSHSAIAKGPACTLEDVLTAESRLVRVDSSNCDYSDVADIVVRSCCHQGVQDTGAFKQQLCDFYGVDILESGEKQRAVKRDGAAMYAIDWDDIGAGRLSAVRNRVRVVETNQYDLEIPYQVLVNYTSLDLNKDGKDPRQNGQILVTWDTSPGTVPATLDCTMIGCTSAEASQSAKRWMAEARLRKRQYEFTLGMKYAFIEPGDRVTLPLDALGNTVVVRVFDLQDRDPLAGTFKVLAYRCGAGTFAPSGTDSGSGGSGGTTGTDEPKLATGFAWSDPLLEPNPKDSAVSNPGFWLALTWPANANDDGVPIYVKGPGMMDPEPFGQIDFPTTIGSMSVALDDGTTALAFEARAGTVVLQDFGELEAISQDTARAGNGLSLIGSEFVRLTGLTPSGTLTYTFSEVQTGINSSPFTGHTTSERFVYFDGGGAKRFPVDSLWIGATIDIYPVPPGVDIADVTPISVTIAAPTSAVDADDVVILEYDWDADDTQNIDVFPIWSTSATGLQNQSPFGLFSASGDHGSTYTPLGYAAQWKYSFASGTVKIKFEPLAPDGTLGTALYSVDYSYRTPPSGGGGGGSSSRGTRVLFSETGVPGGNSITGTVETAFASHYSIPGGLLVAGQIVQLVLRGTISPSDDYTARVYFGSTLIAITDNPVSISNSGLTNFEIILDITILADGVSGSVRAKGGVSLFNDAGDKDMVPLFGTDTAVDLSVSQDLTASWDWVASGKTVVAQQFDVKVFDTVGSGADESVLDTTYLRLDGTNAMTAALDAGSNLISNVTDPASPQDAATKAYVDAHAGGSTRTRTSFVGDGSTTSWTVPAASDYDVFLNGQLLTPGLSVGPSYVISGTTLTPKLDGSTYALDDGGGTRPERLDVLSYA